jgi:S-adenosylmethionine decarboxylase
MNVGIEWLVDAEGCSAESLNDLEMIRRVCERLIAELGLRVIGQGHWHKFAGPGGVTGLFLLTESHLACHTYPEIGVATFNLYCCRPRPDWPWQERLVEMLGATQVTVRRAARGAQVAEVARDKRSFEAMDIKPLVFEREV